MNSIKTSIYNILTLYFQFWAKLVLFRWKPIIIAVVGSAGKTSTMVMIEQVIKNHVSIKTSHKTNAASAIPLNILGLSQHKFDVFEWLKLIIQAPFASLITPKTKIYLCELDTDREGEMALHTRLIKPDICCWVSASPAHTANFKGETAKIIYDRMFQDQSQAAQKTKSLILFNNEDELIIKLVKQLPIKSYGVSLDVENTHSIIKLKSHRLSFNGTDIICDIDTKSLSDLIAKQFTTNQIKIHNSQALISKINLYGMGMAIIIGISFGLELNKITQALEKYQLPAGRMSLFAGKYATTIIDSSYNASKIATKDALGVLKSIGNNGTLAILGDLRELGVFASNEHEDLAKFLIGAQIDRLILIGPAMKTYALPILIKNGYVESQTIFCLSPKEAKELVSQPKFLKSGETILIKGSQNTLFLEEIVECLLVSPKDKNRLCRRGDIWDKARARIY